LQNSPLAISPSQHRTVLACIMPVFLALLILPQTFALDPFSASGLAKSQVEADVLLEQRQLANPQESLRLDVRLSNPADSAQEVYISRLDGSTLVPLGLVAKLQPGEIKEASYYLEVKYSGKLSQSSTYYIVSADDTGTLSLATSFTHTEDWLHYKIGIESYLSKAYQTALPLFLAIFATVTIAVILFVQKHSKETSNRGEFTIHSFLLPIFASKLKFQEKLSIVFINPVFWLDELLFMLVLLLVIATNLVSQYGHANAFYILGLAGIGAASFPLLYLLCAYFLDFWVAHKPFRFFLAFFCWGIFSAVLSFFLTSVYTSSADLFGFASLGSATVILAALISPLVEELLKGLGVYIGSRHHAFDSAASGLLMGFAVGLGFSFVENWFYFTSRSSPFELGLVGWVSFIVYRSFFNSIAHGIFSAALGGFIGYLKSHPSFQKHYHFGLWPGILAAVTLHSIFNSSAIIDSLAISDYNLPVFVFNPAVTIILDILFAVALVFAIRDVYHRHIKHRIGK